MLSYCSVLQKIYESESNVPHVVHIQKTGLLPYQFLIWHQSSRMMWECDRISQYNRDAESWRENKVENESTEVSLAAHSEPAKEVMDHPPVVLFKIYIMYEL